LVTVSVLDEFAPPPSGTRTIGQTSTGGLWTPWKGEAWIMGGGRVRRPGLKPYGGPETPSYGRNSACLLL
jgi:hypothetical protein